MSIGATLAAARRRAGLTVGEVSQRTRVTEPIIRGIEQDDYAACGGDFYARGHIRAIARAVGEDPVPLIDEFDSTWRSAKEITAAEAFQPAMPLRKRERRRVRWTAVLAVLVLAVLGFASYKFVSGVGRARPAAAASPRPSPPGGPTNPPASAPAVQGSTAQSTSAQASASQASTSPAPSASPVTVQVLAPASVTAFGPAGRADGDDPQRAALAIGGDRGPALDQPVVRHRAVRGAEAGDRAAAGHGPSGHRRLGPGVPGQHSGADIQLRAGSKPVPAWLPRGRAAPRTRAAPCS